MREALEELLELGIPVVMGLGLRLGLVPGLVDAEVPLDACELVGSEFLVPTLAAGGVVFGFPGRQLEFEEFCTARMGVSTLVPSASRTASVIPVPAGTSTFQT